MTQIHFTDYQWERLGNKQQCIKSAVSSTSTANIVIEHFGDIHADRL